MLSGTCAKRAAHACRQARSRPGKGAAGRGRGVKTLLMQVKFDVAGVDLAEEGDEILQGTSKPIDRPSHDDVSNRRRVASRHKRSNAGRAISRNPGREEIEEYYNITV